MDDYVSVAPLFDLIAMQLLRLLFFSDRRSSQLPPIHHHLMAKPLSNAIRMGML